MSLALRAAALAFAVLAPAAALACPDVAQTGYALAYTSDQAYAPQSTRVIAGGPSSLASCGADAQGYVAVAPDFEMTFTANGMGRALEFRVVGECDTVLLVNDAQGNWHFNDDASDSTLDPAIRLSAAPEGLYDIWVGTYGPDLCDAELIVETF